MSKEVRTKLGGKLVPDYATCLIALNRSSWTIESSEGFYDIRCLYVLASVANWSVNERQVSVLETFSHASGVKSTCALQSLPHTQGPFAATGPKSTSEQVSYITHQITAAKGISGSDEHIGMVD